MTFIILDLPMGEESDDDEDTALAEVESDAGSSKSNIEIATSSGNFY